MIPKEDHTHTLIWMHGLGDTAMGFLDVFHSSNSPVSASTKVILLTAPTRPVTINAGSEMPAWYDYMAFDFTNPEKSINMDQAKESTQRIIDVIT